MTWTIRYEGVTRLLSEYGISNLERIRKNLLTDRVRFRISGDALSSNATFTANSHIEIFNGSVRWFVGVVTQTPLYCSSSHERYEYEVSGLWWYLENLIYQQTWKECADPTQEEPDLYDVYKSRVILGQDTNGDPITIGQQISDVINYGIFCGAPLRIGSIDIGVNIPFDECKDLSCADIIRRLLRWVPDTVYHIDYSTPVPEISFFRREQMSSVTLTIPDQVEEFSLQPRHDLQVPSVVLKFETSNSINGKVWKESVQQKYPINSTGQELKALVLTINLEGSRENYIVQEITTQPITLTSISWWQSHIPSLNMISSNNITVRDAVRTSNLTNELISGNIADWMHMSAETDIVRCKISYFDSDEAVVDREVAVKIIATDGITGTYRKLVSLATAERVPANLAEEIFKSVSPLQYDGSVSFISRELSEDYFGRLLNLSGGQVAWQTMQAVIQEVVEYVDTGKVVIKFGPAKHLGAADLAELTRSGRLLLDNRNATGRTSAEASAGGTIEQGIYSRVDNTSFGTGKYKMIKFSDPDNGNKSIRLDMDDVSNSVATIQFREEDVCESGVLKKRYSLASEPYER